MASHDDAFLDDIGVDADSSTSDPALAYAARMATGDGGRLRITAYDASGAEVAFRVQRGDGRRRPAGLRGAA